MAHRMEARIERPIRRKEEPTMVMSSKRWLPAWKASCGEGGGRRVVRGRGGAEGWCGRVAREGQGAV
jgi:hypothetical protein